MSCYGVIAPVQAWSFANSLFDTRQAKRLFGLIGAGASLGAIVGRRPGARAGRAGRRHRQPAAGAGAAHRARCGDRAGRELRIRRVGLTRRRPAGFAPVRGDLAGDRRHPLPAAARRAGLRSWPSRPSGRRCSSGSSRSSTSRANSQDITRVLRHVQLRHRGRQLPGAAAHYRAGASHLGRVRRDSRCSRSRWPSATG